MRWIKLLMALLGAKRKSKLGITDESKISFSVWPTDIDISIMNHAAIMTVMEMGRIDFMVRSGFLKLAREKKWYFPSASISTQFIRPLRIFQKASVTTRIFHMDEHWIYMEQKMERNEKLIAICVVKGTVKKERQFIPTTHIVKELQLGEIPFEGKELVDSLELENKLMYERFMVSPGQ
jgi:acyl-CoA thioesterase FadM